MSAASLVVLAGLVALPVAVADSTVVLGNNVLHSIAVLTPLGPTSPAKVIGGRPGASNANAFGAHRARCAMSAISVAGACSWLSPRSTLTTTAIPAKLRATR